LKPICAKRATRVGANRDEQGRVNLLAFKPVSTLTWPESPDPSANIPHLFATLFRAGSN
jgi:hypothetical protein